MPTNYLLANRDRFEKRTGSQRTYVLVYEHQHAGTVTVLYPKDGAGVVRCQIHFFAGPMGHVPSLYGQAGGYGYDKASAAIYDALRPASLKKSAKAYLENLSSTEDPWRERFDLSMEDIQAAFDAALVGHSGGDGSHRDVLEKLGYEVWPL